MVKSKKRSSNFLRHDFYKTPIFQKKYFLNKIFFIIEKLLSKVQGLMFQLFIVNIKKNLSMFEK